MKAYIGYGVFDKRDMVEWMLSGIRENFPAYTHAHFHFEACKDDSRQVFDDLVTGPNRFENIGDLNIGWTWKPEHILEHGVHRLLIEKFMVTDCDVLIVPQDDNRFQAPLLPQLQVLWNHYGETLGWIGGRDGHDFGYQNMVSSPFSESTGADKQTLPIDAYREVRMLNTGPVVYFRHVIEKVGLPDAEMPWYWWSDYSLKCDHAGLKNILLSMDCLHTKFGRCGSNPDLYKPELVADCLRRFNERWKPVYGRNPL